MFIKRIYFNEILYFAELSRREKRLKAYSKNYMHRRRVRNFFYSWRGVTHVWFKERINKEAVEFEQKQRDKELTQWDKEVDALKVYMA